MQAHTLRLISFSLSVKRYYIRRQKQLKKVGTIWGTKKLGTGLSKVTQSISGEAGMGTQVAKSRAPNPGRSTLLPLQSQIQKDIWIGDLYFSHFSPIW